MSTPIGYTYQQNIDGLRNGETVEVWPDYCLGASDIPVYLADDADKDLLRSAEAMRTLRRYVATAKQDGWQHVPLSTIEAIIGGNS